MNMHKSGNRHRSKIIRLLELSREIKLFVNNVN